MLNHNVSVVSVSQLNTYLKSVLDSNPILNNLLVKGEVSNLKYYPSGHIYFSLKDEEGVVKCVMFSTYASKLTTTIKDGDKIIVSGSLSVYGASGAYQIYAKSLEKDGLGNLHLEFEKLKKELMEKGLFDENHKKSLPLFPLKIGIISGKTAAGLRDIITIIKRRWKLAEIIVFPCLVQGKEAPISIIKALDDSSRFDLDLVILARGGGSKEDLWCFNDERLAYAIYNYKKPLITGIGHEIDFTIADFVADLRAPTPSGAAEISTPDMEELISSIQSYKNILYNKAKQVVNDKRTILLDYESSLTKEAFFKLLNSKREIVKDKKEELRSNYFKFSSLYKNQIDENLNLLKVNYNYYLKNKRISLTNEIRLLDNISPLKVLQRGYSVVSNANGIVNSVSQLEIDDVVRITLSDGKVYANITRKDDNYGK